MVYTNNVMIVRNNLLARIVSLWKKGEFIEQIDRIPYDMIPKHRNPVGRCWIHKVLAVLKF